MTSKATLAELRRLTLARWCPTCKTWPGSRCVRLAPGDVRDAVVEVNFFHEARYGPVREAWNARRETGPILYRQPTTATRIQGNVFAGGGHGGSGGYTFPSGSGAAGVE